MKRRPTRGRSRTATPSRPAQAAASRPAVPTLPPVLVLSLVLVGAIVLHHGALRLPFFADDYLFLQQVRGQSLPAVLVAPDAIGNFFRPVGRQLYFWLLGRLSGESPVVFHAANLAFFLGILSLLFVIVRQLAGTMAATVAAGFLALHYAVDVPLRWVSGSQDLLAVLGALGAIALHLGGRSLLAAPVLLLALLSKETVLLTPLIAAAAGRRPGVSWREGFRRAWPLGVAFAVWIVLWLATASQRLGLGASLGWEPLGAVAVLVHLLQVIMGLEWRGMAEALTRALPPWLAIAPVAVALLGVRASGSDSEKLRQAVATGVVWALAAAVPLVAVASMWSSYYYLFALCGAAIAIGALAARGPRWMALAMVVALAMGSQSGRTNPEFAGVRGAWSWQSRVNRRYIDRATERISRYLDDLKRARPTVPPRSTFFFAGIPSFLAWQAADGPLVRWAYRDTSLRSYYQSDFTFDRGSRGPAYFFVVAGDTLHEEVRRPSDVRGIAMRVLLDDHYDTTRDLLFWLAEHEPPSADVLYLLAWLEWGRGDTLIATRLLGRAGLGTGRGPAPEVSRALALAGAGDTLHAIAALDRAALREPLDPKVHSLLADLMLRVDRDDPQARIEALAARVLAPEDASNWLRWGFIQAYHARHGVAIRSLERALALGIDNPVQAASVQGIIAELRRAVPGGDLAQRALRQPPGTGGGRDPGAGP